MSILSIMGIYPIGTRLRLVDDYPGTERIVHGYEAFKDNLSLIFCDGTSLNVQRIELIEEVITCK